MNGRQNKTFDRLLEAIARGYYVTEDGRAYGPKGELKVQCYGAQKVPSFSTNWGKRVYGLPLHQLAAVCFYGEAAVRDAQAVRHLDANTLNLKKSNIALGTHKQNELDKPKEARIRVAVLARAAQGKAAKNRKLNEAQVERVRKFYAALGGRKAPNGSVTKLSSELGVSRNSLAHIRNNKNYAC